MLKSWLLSQKVIFALYFRYGAIIRYDAERGASEGLPGRHTSRVSGYAIADGPEGSHVTDALPYMLFTRAAVPCRQRASQLPHTARHAAASHTTYADATPELLRHTLIFRHCLRFLRHAAASGCALFSPAIRQRRYYTIR